MNVLVKFRRANAARRFFTAVLVGSAVCVGCGTVNRGPVAPANGRITASLSVVRGEPSEVPDLKLVLRNSGSHPASFVDMAGLFWGDVVLRCDDSLFVLRQRDVWRHTGFRLQRDITMAPGAEI